MPLTKKCTDPSPIATYTPPGCWLREATYDRIRPPELAPVTQGRFATGGGLTHHHVGYWDRTRRESRNWAE